MSIIHDALKKIQQGQQTPPKNDETPLFASPIKPAEQEPPAIELSAPKKNKTTSALAVICALVFTIGALIFCYRQMNTYFPQLKRAAKSSFYKLIHKKEIPDFKTKAPQDLVPLAKITVNPPKPLSPSNVSTIATTAQHGLPVTLSIHGVMSNGSGTLVLINDSVYQEGDDVDGVKIVKISLNSITVINNGKEETIYVKN
jgi:hypothetical protein